MYCVVAIEYRYRCGEPTDRKTALRPPVARPVRTYDRRGARGGCLDAAVDDTRAKAFECGHYDTHKIEKCVRTGRGRPVARRTRPAGPGAAAAAGPANPAVARARAPSPAPRLAIVENSHIDGMLAVHDMLVCWYAGMLAGQAIGQGASVGMAAPLSGRGRRGKHRVSAGQSP